MDFANRLYSLRRQRGMSQEDLAAAVEVTRQTVSKWETGDSTPDMERLMALAKVFDISLDALVLGREPTATRLDALGQKVLTAENGRRAKRGLKLALCVLGAVLAVDALSLIVVMLLNIPI